MTEKSGNWDMEELLEFLVSHSGGRGNATAEAGSLHWSPPADVYELDGLLHVVLDIPGMKAKEFEIHIREGALIVTGDRRMRHDESRKRYHTLERNSGLFLKRVTLPEGYITSRPKSRYSEGLLEITFPQKKKGRSG